ncbi:hypothetical protein CspHIS471_0410670 [Cutaneotrichosporon sp. HIS471]|nr:hypothetical protein CspHIS471_0410670 [Cutaneotrichosporon sp. HIS471]
MASISSLGLGLWRFGSRSPSALSSPLILPAVRGIRTIQLQVLIDAANPPPPTGLAYAWHVILKLFGMRKEVGFEDLLSPAPGTDGEVVKWKLHWPSVGDITSWFRETWYWRREEPLPQRGRWEDIHFWYGPMEV